MNIARMTNLLGELGDLVNMYGLSEVEYALKFITGFPENKVRFSDPYSGQVWMLTEKQTNSINEAFHAGAGRNRIQAIKLFREITGSGLKEAKDTIDKYFNWFDKPF